MNNKAFTLIELIVIITIIGVLIMLATPNANKIKVESNEVQILNSSKILKSLIEVNSVKKNNNLKDISKKGAFELLDNKKVYLNGQHLNDTLELKERTNEIFIINNDYINDVIGDYLKGDFYYTDSFDIIYTD